MRFKLILNADKSKAMIPLNYYYPISAWIYKKIQQADEQYADFLHNKGYQSAGKHFKFFTFSSLQVPQFKIENDRMAIYSPQIELILSFYMDKAAEKFIMGVFKDQTLELADDKSKARFIVNQVEMQPLEIKQETIQIYTLSPLVISQKGEYKGKITDIYLHPIEDELAFKTQFAENLISKYLAAKTQFPDLPLSPEMPSPQIKILDTSRMKRKGITVQGNTEHPIKVIGYEGLSFELTAPIPMLEVGLLGGFGKYNATGMGCGGVR